jgi:Zn-dependent peptidase ImmA (M78 family)
MERKGIQYAVAMDLVCNQTKVDIDRLAEKAATEMLAPAGDILELTKKLGGRIHYHSIFENTELDTIFVHGMYDFDIVLPDHSTPRRDRFTIAHELGHFFLHSWMGERPLKAARNGSDRAEWEANWFAAGLLMPKAKFKSAHSEKRSLSWLADRFEVSEHAAKIRCAVLNLAIYT